MQQRIIPYSAIVTAVADLCGKAACDLPPDVLDALRRGEHAETSENGRDFFGQYLENADIARRERLPICQDTGFAVFFVEYGTGAALDRDTIYGALAEGT